MNFRLLIFLVLLSNLGTNCSSDNTRCGDIIEKQIVNGKFYFIMDAGSDIFNTNNNSGIDSYVPDNSVSGEVTQNIYESFNVGDEYCSE